MKKIAIFYCLILIGCEKVFNENITSVTNTAVGMVSNKPNVIIILADDIGYEIPTYTGGQSYSTPNIDFIARNGIQFCEMRATPLCSPSRVQLLTGKYNFRNYDNWGKINPDNYTVADLMKSAGYNTCITGKWQLGGADTSIVGCGFDKYLVWDPYTAGSGLGRGFQYRNPTLYENGILSTYTHDEYGEDIIRNYMFNFIDSINSIKKNFFCFWTPNLGHDPHLPTPDDPDYLTVAPVRANSDLKYYPSMIKYLDKEIGMLVNHLESIGATNTYIIFLGDNGTPQGIRSNWRGRTVNGGKNTALDHWGTHVPMVVYKKGIIPRIDSTLVDLTDVMATLAEATGQQLPTNDEFDGQSFWDQIRGVSNPSPRLWSFTYFYPQPITQPTNLTRWVEDKQFKLYDSSFAPSKKNNMYRIYTDSVERFPLKLIYPETQAKYDYFKHILDSLHN
ncbi:sulfatase-like hydrolase/transferase [Panacibacter sp. DH6]|uniref:Sulfatase-like hydrolase/transferase n=1 Tax=Panacibacter microcysteis TaxID=2793269 RepID=A0A931E8Z7_9BACT|nr:sulfatase-like hydrolase/transferase [Panacibacter microcysteis]MBG9377348.1 sulfatase-like hydrolase/transferase [Panacibacter microcysteis]